MNFIQTLSSQSYPTQSYLLSRLDKSANHKQVQNFEIGQLWAEVPIKFSSFLCWRLKNWNFMWQLVTSVGMLRLAKSDCLIPQNQDYYHT